MQIHQKPVGFKAGLILSLVSIVLATYSLSAFAQGSDSSTPKSQNEDKVYDFNSLKQHPWFQDGNDDFRAFLDKNLKYPVAAKKKKIEGVVWVGIIIEKDGSLSGLKIIGKPQLYLDAEALRVLKLAPKFHPGEQDGVFVRVSYSIPIKFDLGDGKLEPPTEKQTSGPPPSGK